MQTTTQRHPWLNTLALLLVLPSVIFISASILKYAFGIEGPYDAMAPSLEQMGISEPIGWNINLLILAGPVIALLIAALQVLNIQWNFSKEQLSFQFTVQKRWLPLAIISLSGLALATLFIYLAGENCHCY